MFKPWSICHVDLSAPLAAIPADPSWGGVVLVYWYKGIPLGRRDVQISQLPLSIARLCQMALKDIAPAVADRLFDRGFCAPLPERRPQPDAPPDFKALQRLRRPLEKVTLRLQQTSNDVSKETFAVIICTRERPDALHACLVAVQALDPAPNEVIVVDNAPRSGATRAVVRAFPDVRYVVEPAPGLSRARNTGLRHTQAALVAFTDDDALVHPNWLGRLWGAFAAPDVVAATGLILPARLDTPAQVLFEQSHGVSGWGFRTLDFDHAFFERMRRFGVPAWRIGAGANMAFRRVVFEDLGGFDERLGAGASGCSEDSEMWYRILARGGVCRYEPAAVVHHIHRREMEHLRHQMFQYMRGHLAALLVQFEKHGHVGNLRRALITLPGYYGKSVLRRVLGRSAGPILLGAQIRGCAAGLSYYFRYRTAAPGAPGCKPIHA